MKLDHSFIGTRRSYDPHESDCVYSVLEAYLEYDYRGEPYVRIRIRYNDGATSGFHLDTIQNDQPHEA